MLAQVTKERQSVGIVIPYLVASDTIEPGSSRQRIKASSHQALPGDLIRLTSSGHVNCEALVVSVTTDYINLNHLFPLTLNAGDTFDILRFSYLSTSNGALPVVTTPIKVSSTNEQVLEVTNTSQTLIAANANRKGGYVQNITDAEIYFSYGTSVDDNGFVLYSYQSVDFVLGKDGPLYTGPMSFKHNVTGTRYIRLVEV